MNKIFITLILLLLTSCSVFKLIKPVTVSAHGIEITPVTSWSKMNLNPHKKSDIWTKDGFGLNELFIIGNIADGETIFKSVNKELPLPQFKSNMLPNELEEFIKTSFKNNYNGKITVKTESLEPYMLGNDVGFRLQLSYYLESGLAKDIDAVMSIKNGKLFLVMYIAPQIHYSEKYRTEINEIFKSIKIL